MTTNQNQNAGDAPARDAGVSPVRSGGVPPTELFPAETVESISPRLAWMRRHSITVAPQGEQFTARQGDHTATDPEEDGALLKLAATLNLKPWWTES